MAAFQGEFCAVNIIIIASNQCQTKINGQYIEAAILQRAGIARVTYTVRFMHAMMLVCLRWDILRWDIHCDDLVFITHLYIYMQEIVFQYQGRGERSVKDTANLVGLKLPPNTLREDFMKDRTTS